MNVNSTTSTTKSAAIGAGIGIAAGALATADVKSASKLVLKKLSIDSFESAKQFINNENIEKAGLFNWKNFKTIDISKDTIGKLAEKAFKTSTSTYVKNAAIVGIAGAAIGVGISKIVEACKNKKAQKAE